MHQSDRLSLEKSGENSKKLNNEPDRSTSFRPTCGQQFDPSSPPIERVIPPRKIEVSSSNDDSDEEERAYLEKVNQFHLQYLQQNQKEHTEKSEESQEKDVVGGNENESHENRVVPARKIGRSEEEREESTDEEDDEYLKRVQEFHKNEFRQVELPNAEESENLDTRDDKIENSNKDLYDQTTPDQSSDSNSHLSASATLNSDRDSMMRRGDEVSDSENPEEIEEESEEDRRYMERVSNFHHQQILNNPNLMSKASMSSNSNHGSSSQHEYLPRNVPQVPSANHQSPTQQVTGCSQPKQTYKAPESQVHLPTTHRKQNSFGGASQIGQAQMSSDQNHHDSGSYQEKTTNGSDHQTPAHQIGGNFQPHHGGKVTASQGQRPNSSQIYNPFGGSSQIGQAHLPRDTDNYHGGSYQEKIPNGGQQGPKQKVGGNLQSNNRESVLETQEQPPASAQPHNGAQQFGQTQMPVQMPSNWNQQQGGTYEQMSLPRIFIEKGSSKDERVCRIIQFLQACQCENIQVYHSTFYNKPNDIPYEFDLLGFVQYLMRGVVQVTRIQNDFVFQLL